MTEFHTTVKPVKEDIDIALDDLDEDEREQVEAEVEAMKKLEEAGEQVGH